MIAINKVDTLRFYPCLKSIKDIIHYCNGGKNSPYSSDTRLKSYKLSLLSYPDMKKITYNFYHDGAIQEGFVSSYSGFLEDFELYDDGVCNNKDLAQELFYLCQNKGGHEFNSPYPDDTFPIVSTLVTYTSYFDYREHKHHPVNQCEFE